MSHIERKTELKRKRQRKAKLAKLKKKMAQAKNPNEAGQLEAKIHRISPFWTPAGSASAAAPSKEKKSRGGKK